jgi:hypothetical protein
MFRIFLNINSISYSFRSIANQNGVRYSDSTSEFNKMHLLPLKTQDNHMVSFHSFLIFYLTININSHKVEKLIKPSSVNNSV